ncbi:MAG TPA: hypothetical protein VNX68_14110, partial [Nitrosopumilaceae archaeon]|nr:hypothetical protein [Nitrosopumilaceae archaeon]
MMLGTSYLVDYFDKSSFKHLVLFSVCWQLAVAANLILVVVMLVLLAYVYIYQLRHKLLFKAKNVLLQIINLALLAFWVKFALFYKEHGALDYGVGDNYWLVTFKTLIFILFNSYEIWLQVSVIVIFVLMMIVIAYNTFKNSFSFKDLFTPQLFYPCALILFILAFYLQKKILDVNYPEDRTGMFFYLFFVMSLAFTIDYAPNILRKVFVLLFLAPSLIYFAVSFNLSDFSTWFYHTMPKSIYQTLVKEQEKEHEFVTIGGHRVREMNYAFANYRGNSVLNCMDNSEEM